MKRKIVSVLLAVGMIGTMLAGCGKQNQGGADAQVTPDGPSDEETYTVAIQLVNIVPELSDIEAVEAEINKITVPKINCKVDIQNLFIGDLPTTTSMNVVGGEKMDIVAVGLTQKLSDIYDDGILMPIDDYLQYAPTYVESVKDLMKAGNINGIQYAIPTNPFVARGSGFVYNKDVADELGITVKDGITFEELNEVFAKVKEKDMYGTSVGEASNLIANQWSSIELFGTNGEYGFIADPINSTTIENYYASDIFRNYCLAAKEWTEMGYMPADSLTDTTTVQEYFSRGRVFGTVSGYDIAQFAGWQKGQDFTIDIAELEKPIVTTSSVVETMWGLADNCENPQKAMELLELIYTDADLANLFMYGIEGEHYTIVEGTENVCTTEGAAKGSDGYTSLFTKFGDSTKILAATPNTDNYAEDVKKYNENVPVSKSLGYTFDASNVSAEAGAVSNTIAEYLPRLQAGLVDDVDAEIEKFVAALETAGISDIIAENQKQLDTYMQQ